MTYYRFGLLGGVGERKRYAIYDVSEMNSLYLSLGFLPFLAERNTNKAA